MSDPSPARAVRRRVALAWRELDLRDPDPFEPRFEGDPQELLDAAELLIALADRPAWMADAACREHPELTWFPGRGQVTTAAKAVGARCLVREECEDFALEQGTWLAGIWGGLSERQRRLTRQGEAA